MGILRIEDVARMANRATKTILDYIYSGKIPYPTGKDNLGRFWNDSVINQEVLNEMLALECELEANLWIKTADISKLTGYTDAAILGFARNGTIPKADFTNRYGYYWKKESITDELIESLKERFNRKKKTKGVENPPEKEKLTIFDVCQAIGWKSISVNHAIEKLERHKFPAPNGEVNGTPYWEKSKELNDEMIRVAYKPNRRSNGLLGVDGEICFMPSIAHALGYSNINDFILSPAVLKIPKHDGEVNGRRYWNRETLTKAGINV